ncbi:patatin-like phospholipase family protein [Rossellomorea marisflavi]|uniref:patatin-like phospholipase family protein n=1 Tax=Rossellomorea marisflavi TaxID=189381 RepID=UPI0009A7FDE5|nr:patatin-like phospholipase family protein [Rossellomorea marisflavi]MDW4527310.1 patatin-like phospholipase family protein [Rossellomorea marisflavi]WJV20393.1 patatin-like phospholipase family protein [Rossellomorea marisflavi]
MEIDGVFSGGGIKGFALIGAYQAVEEKGYTFKRLAGTSAGAIISAFIAAGYTSKEIAKLMDEVDVKTFMDASPFSLPIIKWFMVYFRLGLYKGKALEAWIGEKLKAKGVETFADLPPHSLRVIASDLSNGRMIVLPDDLDGYGIPKETFPVARAIRMSANLPFFFEPVKLKSLEGTSITVDGGVLSNFPMWLFDKETNKSERPVLGVKLSHDLTDQPKKVIKNAIELYQALFTTMRDAHDARYISRKHERNIVFIPTEGVMTTDFELDGSRKSELIEFGRTRTAEFLKYWH